MSKQGGADMESSAFDEGMSILDAMLGEGKNAYIEKLNSLYDGLGNSIAEQVFGKLYGMPALDLKTKQLITVALMLENGDEEQLLFHAQGALNLGVTKEQLVEAALQSITVIGIPRALRGLKIIRKLTDK